jgi:flagellar motor protein MotB
MSFKPPENKVPRGYIEEDDPQVSRFGHPAPPWLVNYADLMTELVCFFIILYALTAVLNKNIQQAKKDIDNIIKEEQLQAEVKITKEGIRMTMEDKGGADSFFQVGKAELTPKMLHILSKMGPLIRKLPNEVLIEGHTDNVPINSEEFPSNWELSSARALTVLHHLVEEYQVDSSRISAIGFGEFRPRAKNDTPENRARNRRVVFFIKNNPPKPEIEEPDKALKKVKSAAAEHKVASHTPEAAKQVTAGPSVNLVPDSYGLAPTKTSDELKSDINKTFPDTPPSH